MSRGPDVAAATRDELFRVFPTLSDADPHLRDVLLAAAQTVLLDAGATVFEAGQDCERYILVRSGSVRVHLLDADGRQIFLYRLRGGDSCVLTTAALLGETPYAACAVAEVATTATGLPKPAFDTLLAQSAAFRRFVFAAQGGRIVDLMQVVSDVAFTRLNVRLSRCLLQRADASGCVAMTHDALAIEIGTAREVVSRNLKALERDGLIRTGQGRVTIVDREQIGRLAERGAA